MYTIIYIEHIPCDSDSCYLQLGMLVLSLRSSVMIALPRLTRFKIKSPAPFFSSKISNLLPPMLLFVSNYLSVCMCMCVWNYNMYVCKRLTLFFSFLFSFFVVCCLWLFFSSFLFLLLSPLFWFDPFLIWLFFPFLLEKKNTRTQFVYMIEKNYVITTNSFFLICEMLKYFLFSGQRKDTKFKEKKFSQKQQKANTSTTK